MSLPHYSAEMESTLKSVVRSMKSHSAQFITPISFNHGNDAGSANGTGWYIRLFGATYLVSAQHVMRELAGWSLAHFPCETSEGNRFTNPTQALSWPEDLAVSRIDKGIWSSASKKALPVSRLSDPPAFSETSGELLFVQGFPGTSSYFSTLGNTLISGSLPYLTQRSPLPARYTEGLHFALHYPEGELHDENGAVASLPDPRGMSGSPVWRLNLDWSRPDQWTPEAATVCGVLIDWDDKAFAIAATSLPVVAGFLIHSLRRERAYFSWKSRGEPSGDDWRDWHEAAEAIRTLRSN
jgi:hypothetical protein